MGDQVPTPVFALILAIVVALALFGVFLNRAVKERLKSWWKGLSIDPFDKEEGEGPGPKTAPGRPHHPEHAAHPSATHLEKKEAHVHRSG